jgi:hypothetical protein
VTQSTLWLLLHKAPSRLRLSCSPCAVYMPLFCCTVRLAVHHHVRANIHQSPRARSSAWWGKGTRPGIKLQTIKDHKEDSAKRTTMIGRDFKVSAAFTLQKRVKATYLLTANAVTPCVSKAFSDVRLLKIAFSVVPVVLRCIRCEGDVSASARRTISSASLVEK